MQVLGIWHCGWGWQYEVFSIVDGDGSNRYLALWMGMPMLGILHRGWGCQF